MAQSPIRRGMLIRHQSHIYEVSDFHERHTGKQKPTVHVQLHDVRDGRVVDRTLDDLLPIQEVERVCRTLQYLYPKGDRHVFMDTQTFEEYELDASQLRGRQAFLADGREYRVVFLDGNPAILEMDDTVPLKVANTAAPGHSVGAAANITKEATLENGLEIRVPLFIKTGDLIRVDTRTKAYVGKEHEEKR